MRTKAFRKFAKMSRRKSGKPGPSPRTENRAGANPAERRKWTLKNRSRLKMALPLGGDGEAGTRKKIEGKFTEKAAPPRNGRPIPHREKV